MAASTSSTSQPFSLATLRKVADAVAAFLKCPPGSLDACTPANSRLAKVLETVQEMRQQMRDTSILQDQIPTSYPEECCKLKLPAGIMRLLNWCIDTAMPSEGPPTFGINMVAVARLFELAVFALIGFLPRSFDQGPGQLLSSINSQLKEQLGLLPYSTGPGQ